jgi:hypothetical protein
MSDPLRDLASGRPRPFAMDRRTKKEDLLIALTMAAAFYIGYPIWHEVTQEPRHRQNAMAALRQAGLKDVQLKREWFKPCPGKGNKRYSWETSRAKGYVCSYERGRLYAGVHLTSVS